MIALDTNFLVPLQRRDDVNHRTAVEAFHTQRAVGPGFVLPWPCLHELFSTLTRMRYLDPPSKVSEVVDFWHYLLTDCAIRPIGETADHLAILERLVMRAVVTGPRIHDARIAAICIGHGIDTIWTADRDFNRFEGLNAVNPLT